MADLIASAAPRHRATYLHPATRDGSEFGKYFLIRQISADNGDECFLAATRGHVELEKRMFLRRFDRALLEPRIDAFKHQARVNRPDVAQIFELGAVEERGFVVSEFIEGASLRDLDDGEPLSWRAVTALAHDVLGHLREITTLGIDAAITPSRVRIALRGGIVICLGLPGVDRRSYHQISCQLLHAILVLAATTDERALLRELFTDESEDAIWVVSDAIVERHRELDPILPLVLLAHAGRADPGAARGAVAERVTPAELAVLWDKVFADRAGEIE